MSLSTAEQLLVELQNQYLQQLPLQVDEIENLSLNLEKSGQLGDYQHLLRKVHSLKGSGGTYGFHILSTICHQFEDFLTEIENKLPQLSTTSVDIIMKYVDLLRETQTLLAQNSLDKYSAQLQTQLQSIKRQGQHQSQSILVIDSAQTAVAIYKNALKELDVTLSSESDPFNALKRLMIEKFDLVITSREFNHMTADALIAALRLSKNANQNIPVILVSSSNNLSKEKIAQPFAILKKSPQMPKDLAEIVKVALK